jgi:GT2 family glycosyltransferase
MVTHNSRENTADRVMWCTDSPTNLRVRIRDNGSPDATSRVLEQLEADGLIDEPGFAIGATHVIRRSSNDDIILMNPCARIALNTIELMRGAAADDPTLGVVSPPVTGGDASAMPAGRQSPLYAMITHYSGLSRIVPNFPMFRGMHPVLSHHPYRDQLVRWSSGRCTYIPRQTVDRADLLSDRSFLYGKDADYCKRISDAGLLRIRVPAAGCGYHATARSSATEPLEELLEDVAARSDGSAAEPAARMPKNGAQPLPDVGTMYGLGLKCVNERQ